MTLTTWVNLCVLTCLKINCETQQIIISYSNSINHWFQILISYSTDHQFQLDMFNSCLTDCFYQVVTIICKLKSQFLVKLLCLFRWHLQTMWVYLFKLALYSVQFIYLFVFYIQFTCNSTGLSKPMNFRFNQNIYLTFVLFKDNCKN